jgi:two-component system, OmpR family, response regulator
MHYTDVYAVTPKGKQELLSSATTISPAEIDLLIRFNGLLTLAQIRQGMSADDALASFDKTIGMLIFKGLTAPVVADPFAASLQFQFSHSSMTEADAEADACAESLKTTHFYVRIARNRPPPPPPPGPAHVGPHR